MPSRQRRRVELDATSPRAASRSRAGKPPPTTRSARLSGWRRNAVPRSGTRSMPRAASTPGSATVAAAPSASICAGGRARRQHDSSCRPRTLVGRGRKQQEVQQRRRRRAAARSRNARCGRASRSVRHAPSSGGDAMQDRDDRAMFIAAFPSRRFRRPAAAHRDTRAPPHRARRAAATGGGGLRQQRPEQAAQLRAALRAGRIAPHAIDRGEQRRAHRRVASRARAPSARAHRDRAWPVGRAPARAASAPHRRSSAGASAPTRSVRPLRSPDSRRALVDRRQFEADAREIDARGLLHLLDVRERACSRTAALGRIGPGADAARPATSR